MIRGHLKAITPLVALVASVRSSKAIRYGVLQRALAPCTLRTEIEFVVIRAKSVRTDQHHHWSEKPIIPTAFV
jgi:hypothetical protein